MQIFQESTFDEADLKERLRELRTHTDTMDFVVENFDKTYNRFKAVLGDEDGGCTAECQQAECQPAEVAYSSLSVLCAWVQCTLTV